MGEQVITKKEKCAESLQNTRNITKNSKKIEKF